jgi:DNA-binding beta-propeller fold protein YncE
MPVMQFRSPLRLLGAVPLLAAVGVLLMAGVAHGELAPPVYGFQFASAGAGAGQLNSPLALATDPSGNVWVADRMNNRIDEYEPSGVFLETIGFGVSDGESRLEICKSGCRAGIAGSGPGQFNDPRGIAINQRTDGLYVSDAGNDRIEGFSSAGSYVGSFGGPGGGPGGLNSPNGIAIDPAGNVWVADTQNNRVEEFDPGGEPATTFGEEGSGNGQLDSPQAVAISAGHVFVADWGNNRIEEFSTTGVYRRQFGSLGSADGHFSGPSRIAVDPLNGDLYVSDNGNTRVQVFGQDGTFLTKFGSAGAEEGRFESLKAVAVNASGTIYTADAGDGRLQEWVAAGLAGPREPAPTYAGSIAPASAVQGSLREPDVVAVDPGGNILIGDSGHSRVLEFNSHLEYVRQFGSRGAAHGQFEGIRGIATDASSDIYVSDYGNDRVEEFSPSGIYLRRLGSPGTGPGQLHGPTGIAVEASTGHIWVRNTYGRLLQAFSADGAYLSDAGPIERSSRFSHEAGGLALSSGMLYVPEAGTVTAGGSGRTRALSSTGRVREFSASGESLGYLDIPASAPSAIAADPSTGNLYVSEPAANRVLELTTTGALIAAFGSGGHGPGQLSRPEGVAVSSSGDVFVADAGNNRVQRWVTPVAPSLSWSAADVLDTPADTGAIRTDGSGRDQPSPPCIFPLGVLLSRICEAPAFPEHFFLGEQSPVVVASRRLTNLTAGETLDAAADIELSNTSTADAALDPIAVTLQLDLSTSPTSVDPPEARVLENITNSPGAAITDYHLEHHATLVSRGDYTVPSSLTEPVYLDAVVTASLPPGSTFGESPCVDPPGDEIEGSNQGLCPLESDTRFSTLSVQRFQPAETDHVPLVVEEATDPSTPGQGETTTFPITAGADRDYPYTPIWQSGEITKLDAAHCPSKETESSEERSQEACAFVEAHGDLTVSLANPGCSVLLGGRFFLTQDRDIVSQAKSALGEAEEKVRLGEEPEYSFQTGTPALTAKFPSYAEYEASKVHVGGEAGTNVTGVGTGIGERTGVHGALNISATVPVSREILQAGEQGPWYVALEVAPEQSGCADSLTVDGQASHAEALVVRPRGPGEDLWSESVGARVATEPVGSGLTSAPQSLITDELRVKGGDIIDVGADAPVEDSLSRGIQELVTLSPCLKLTIGQSEYPLRDCAVQDLSSLQRATDAFHSGSFTVPATVPPGTPATLSYVMAAAAASTSPARVAGAGDLDVELYEPHS